MTQKLLIIGGVHIKQIMRIIIAYISKKSRTYPQPTNHIS